MIFKSNIFKISKKLNSRLGIGILFLLTSFLVNAETLYVTAEKATLHSEPKATASAVTQLKRATPVEVVKKEGLWIQVKVQNKLAYINRLMVSPNKPVGKADLMKDMDKPSEEKISRRRPVGNTDTVASTRGLSADSFLARKRGGTDFYQRDIEEIEALEKKVVPVMDLLNFADSANLTR